MPPRCAAADQAAFFVDRFRPAVGQQIAILEDEPTNPEAIAAALDRFDRTITELARLLDVEM